MSFDTQMNTIIDKEFKRQNEHLELIASENFVSQNVLKAQGSILTNKYAEGYPGRRYYDGCQFVDEIEQLAIDRLKELYNAEYANVQPHSGSQANQAVLFALLNPGDTILSMSLKAGGHLSHGTKVSLSGKWFNIVSYEVSKTTNLIEYEEIEKLARKYRPKLIIAGYSAYSRSIDFQWFRKIADQVGAYLLADIAHIAGIIAAKFHMNPLPYADVVTSTTHKTLRGPRGGIIMTNEASIFKKINSAVFPGIQGGPLMHAIAAKAVAFHEALQPSFSHYIAQVLKNAQALSTTLIDRGYCVITDGTDNHMIIVKFEHLTGKEVSNGLSSCGIICNKNGVPFDQKSTVLTSGIRLGSPACTTRGMKVREFTYIGNLIADILDLLKNNALDSEISKMQKLVQELCLQYPLKL